MQDMVQQADPQDAIINPEASEDFHVLKAGYLDKQLRQQQRQDGAAANAKQHASNDNDGSWKQRYVEIVVDSSASTMTTSRELEAKPTRARLIFRQAPGGRELGSIPLLPPTESLQPIAFSDSMPVSRSPLSSTDGTRIVRSSCRRQQREHQNSNAVWSVFTVETRATDVSRSSSSRQVSFRALDHGTVSEWCSAVERALQLVAESNLE